MVRFAHEGQVGRNGGFPRGMCRRSYLCLDGGSMGFCPKRNGSARLNSAWTEFKVFLSVKNVAHRKTAVGSRRAIARKIADGKQDVSARSVAKGSQAADLEPGLVGTSGRVGIRSSRLRVASMRALKTRMLSGPGVRNPFSPTDSCDRIAAIGFTETPARYEHGGAGRKGRMWEFCCSNSRSFGFRGTWPGGTS